MITNGPPPAATFVRRSIGNAHLDFTLAGAAARRFAALAVLERNECRVTLSELFFFRVAKNLHLAKKTSRSAPTPRTGAGMADQDAQQVEGGFMDGLQTSVADISLNLELDTPPRTRRANDNSTIMMDGRMPLSPAAAEPAALHGTTKGREESAASQMQSIDDRKVDPEAAKDRLATPTNATASFAELQRQESGLSTASNMSAIQLQTPATCRGNLAESERGLLRESGGAMVCLFSQDMAPLLSVRSGKSLERCGNTVGRVGRVSFASKTFCVMCLSQVAHGIQLPRAQIGLLGAWYVRVLYTKT